MNRRDKIVFWAAIILTLGGTAYGLMRIGSIESVTGAVLRDDSSPENQWTIPNVEISGDALVGGSAKSDSHGYFNLKLRRGIRKGETISLRLRHPDYLPLDTQLAAADCLCVIHMRLASTASGTTGAPIAISDVRLRYSVKNQIQQNVGSVTRVFLVANTGNVPCGSDGVCSPDGKWKASIAGASLDAGEDSEFQDARVSCIAGPCPFTAIENDSFSRGGRKISVSVRNWSDSASFVLEAEVMRTVTAGEILHSYPIIFNRTASFTLPANAEGMSIEATLDHQEIVYPLGPEAKLSWADCDVQTSKNLSKLYRCSLKSGYQFR
jgi:hypothetical protein